MTVRGFAVSGGSKQAAAQLTSRDGTLPARGPGHRQLPRPGRRLGLRPRQPAKRRPLSTSRPATCFRSRTRTTTRWACTVTVAGIYRAVRCEQRVLVRSSRQRGDPATAAGRAHAASVRRDLYELADVAVAEVLDPAHLCRPAAAHPSDRPEKPLRRARRAALDREASSHRSSELRHGSARARRGQQRANASRPASSSRHSRSSSPCSASSCSPSSAPRRPRRDVPRSPSPDCVASGPPAPPPCCYVSWVWSSSSAASRVAQWDGWWPSSRAPDGWRLV